MLTFNNGLGVISGFSDLVAAVDLIVFTEAFFGGEV